MGHLHYLVSDVVRQRPPVDEDPTKLVHSALAQRGGHCVAKKKKKKTLKNIHIQRDFIQFKVSYNTDEILIWLDDATFAAFISIRTQFAHIIILTIFQGRFVPNSSWQDASKDPLRDAISYPRDTREDGTPHLDYS